MVVYKAPIVQLSLFLLLSLGGCSEKNENVAPTKGKVTLDGQPLPNAFVTFTSSENGSTSYGKTNSSGSFVMKFSDWGKGAWIGETIVRITTREWKGEGGGIVLEQIPAVYNHKSRLVVNVKPKSNYFAFELKSTEGKIIQECIK